MSLCLPFTLLVVCVALLGCDSKTVRPDKVDVTVFELDQGSEADLAVDLPVVGAHQKRGTAFESLRVRGAHIVFTLIQPEGLLVTEDFECLEQDRAPTQFLEAMACWHAEHGWLDVRHCVHDGLEGQQAYPWSAPLSAPSGLLVELGDSGEVCEREAMKSGFEVMTTVPPSWTIPLWVVHDSITPMPSPPCVLKPVFFAESMEWANTMLLDLRPKFAALLDEKTAESCDAVLFDGQGHFVPWVLAMFGDLDGDVKFMASDILSFPHVPPHKINAVRSIDLRGEGCALSIVWGHANGGWSLLGLNESTNFTSMKPFGEGQVDIASATCSDLNVDGSPELWFHSGSETEGGWSYVDLGGDIPRWLFSRYTGD